jgi:hypothetical protein
MSMGDHRRSAVLPFGFVGLLLSGCGAQPTPVVLAAAAGPDMGGVLVAFSPTAATFDDEQARLVQADDAPGAQVSAAWQLRIDGSPAVFDGGEENVSAVTVTEGGQSVLGYLDAGPHHFTVAAPGGGPTFDGDAEIPSGGTLRLFLFGPPDALQGRFVSTPDLPASGNQHVTVVNLLRTGQSLEVVACTGLTACAPVSPALSLGDLFDTEVPAPGEGAAATITADGVGIGYRVAPSLSLPAPPVLALTAGGATAAATPDVFVAAPVYMSDQGELLYGFN